MSWEVICRAKYRRADSFYYTTLEMEFLDINLIQDSSLLLHAIHSPFYWRILKNTIFFLKSLTKKSMKQENSILFMNSIL
jgi:hypothetical protein